MSWTLTKYDLSPTMAPQGKVAVNYATFMSLKT
jgi:hypothetical protein